MSASQPDECHGGVPTGGAGMDGQGEGCAAAQDGTEEAELEAARRDVLAKAKAWRAMRLDLQGLPVKPKREAAALIAAVDELVRIEGQR